MTTRQELVALRERVAGARVSRAERMAAGRKLRTELEAGRMRRPETCETCGTSPGRGKNGITLIQGHHAYGYHRPLDVQWLCTKCHRAVTPRPATRGPILKIRGEKNPAAKLSEADVVFIKRAISQGIKGILLAEIFGVSAKQVSDIKLNRVWRHVSSPALINSETGHDE